MPLNGYTNNTNAIMLSGSSFSQLPQSFLLYNALSSGDNNYNHYERAEIGWTSMTATSTFAINVVSQGNGLSRGFAVQTNGATALSVLSSGSVAMPTVSVTSLSATSLSATSLSAANLTQSGRIILGDRIFIQCWGAGGGGGTVGGWSLGSYGGGGGYSEGYLYNIAAGTSLTLIVGGGGQVNNTTSAFGGGGIASPAGADNRYGSGGGGYTGIFNGTVSQANAIIIAGGGGGGGSSRSTPNNSGGGGGGFTGQDGLSDWDGSNMYRGMGGTQYTAGRASVGATNAQTQGALQGGPSAITSYGGAGGGGFFGGSGGSYAESNTMAGGGGGSGYINGSYIREATSITGDRSSSGGMHKLNWDGTSGMGGNYQSAGQNGMIAITRNGTTTIYSYTGANQTFTV